MEILQAILLVVLLVLVPAYLFFSSSSFPALPGPKLSACFPNGEVFPMLRDSRSTLRTFLSLWKKYGDVYQLWIGPSRAIVTAVPADVAQVLSSNEFKRPKGMIAMFDTVAPGSLFAIPPETHQRIRKVFRENFNVSLVEAFQLHITDAIEELCCCLANKAGRPGEQPSEVVDISEQLSLATFRVITNVAFGCRMTRDERLRFAEMTDVLIDEMLQDFLGYPFRQALTPLGVRNRLFESTKAIRETCATFIQQRADEKPEDRANRPPDFLDTAMKLDQKDMVSLISHTMVMAVAGSHTTNQVLAWSIFEAWSNASVNMEIDREIQKQFGERPLTEPVTAADVKKLPYLRSVWKETLRVHPPGAFLARVAATNVLLKGSGITVPKGAHIMALIHGSQSHPEYWSDPQEFKPERWGLSSGDDAGLRVTLGAYVPFSVGVRNCPGSWLADAEGIMILAELYRRFKFTLACEKEDVVTCTGWVESAKTASRQGKERDMGVPVHIELRETPESAS